MEWKKIHHTHVILSPLSLFVLVMLCKRISHYSLQDYTLKLTPCLTIRNKAKNPKSIFFLTPFWSSLRLRWCNDVNAVHHPCWGLLIRIKLEKKRNQRTAELLFTTQVIAVDFKYKTLWCMLEILAVNMPSTGRTKKKNFPTSFMFFCFLRFLFQLAILVCSRNFSNFSNLACYDGINKTLWKIIVV